jgi:hypothetical protein
MIDIYVGIIIISIAIIILIFKVKELENIVDELKKERGDG